MVLNVYNEKNEITKSCEAHTINIRFGTIRKLMKLVNVDNIEDTGELLKIVYGAWEELTSILSECFPDMTDEDWDNVHVNELLPCLIHILKDSFKTILTIPNDPKN